MPKRPTPAERALEAHTSQLPVPNRHPIKELCLRAIYKAIDEGMSLPDACAAETGLPHVMTVYKQAVSDPEVGAMLNRYRQVRAFVLDQQIEDIGTQLTNLNQPLTATEVQRLAVAARQKQWNAAHNFPQMFGERGPQQPTMAVTINTNLPLDVGTTLSGDYTITAALPQKEEPSVQDAEWEVELSGPTDELENHQPQGAGAPHDLDRAR